MSDPRKPKADAPEGGPVESTDRHARLPSAEQTMSDDDDVAQLDPPTIGPRHNTKPPGTVLEKSVPKGAALKEPSSPRAAPLREASAARGAPLKEPSVSKGTPLREPSSPKGVPLEPGQVSKSKLPAVGPRTASKQVPAVSAPRTRTRSSTRVPVVSESPTDPPRPALMDESEGKTESRPALSEELKTDARPALPPEPKTDEREALPPPAVRAEPKPQKVAESPTTLRPSLIQAEDTDKKKRPPDLVTTPGALGSAVELNTGKLPSLRGDPGLSTMGYRSLQALKGERLLDRKTALILGGAVSGTFLLGAILWKLASPAPPQPRFDPSRPTALPRTAVKDAKPPPEPEKPPEPATAKKSAVMLEETVDAGNGMTRTVKVPAGTIQILSTPDVTITRNGLELGKTPITITLPVGRNELQVANRAEGLARTMSLEILDDKNESVRWTFVRGRVAVNAPPGTKVSVDGRAVGKVPLQEIPLWPGTHTVDITFPKGDKEQRKVQIEAGTTQAVYFEAPVHDVDVSQ
jgi:hypothetical protein